MSIKQWQYSYGRKKLYEYEQFVRKSFPDTSGMGFVYAVKIPVPYKRMSFLKIGATISIQGRFTGNFPANTIYAVSPLHYNYYENEQRLHEYFAKFRIPPRHSSTPELFNISISHFFESMPLILYETYKSNCTEVYERNYAMPIYCSKAYQA